VELDSNQATINAMGHDDRAQSRAIYIGGRATSPVLAKSDLMATLKSKAAALGMGVKDDGADALSGEVKSIRAKWVLGARTVTYRMSCRLDDAAHAAHFREAVVETSWGLPPPTFTTEWTTIKGWARSGERTDRSVGGGGTIDYARVREEFEQTVNAVGWLFQYKGGRMP